MIPGEIFVASGEIELNAGREKLVLRVDNTGDRPVQVGSHFHFYEANEALRFEPGEGREVELVALGGARTVYGFNAKIQGPLEGAR